MGRRPLTRPRIVARTRQLVRRHGADRVSLRSVARDLGVTAPALYAHVDDFDELLAAVAAEEFQRLTATFDAIDAAVPGADPVERMRALGRAYVDHARAEPALHRLMFRYPPSLPEAGIEDAFGPATHAFTAAMRPVRDGIASGRLRPVDPFVAALGLWAAAHGVAEVLLMGFAFPDDVAGALVDSVLDAAIAHLVADTP